MLTASVKVDSRYRWDAFRWIEVDDSWVYFHLTDLQAVLVPSRAFGGELQFRAFLESARTYWQQSRDALGPTE
jgi:hypothetical protein